MLAKVFRNNSHRLKTNSLISKLTTEKKIEGFHSPIEAISEMFIASAIYSTLFAG